ncbi:MAG: hypothetical protein KME28_21825 [Pelatocladus maniniholoensis HA4357-MV3]|jgi:membrane protein implicated in regulation of membrane protease activity|uniref:Uncharacterized protein n=1 Tax=Pelatocladus maniniholoensis HA4357-MV3 TaxID=1117104 RepID=A0A9E3LVP1_9NOST|nr:hypothetical protein [Pelatocladus maniniholoensis HA4357-MV3]BAZ66474.1 hypothetical protein NIES4106_12260 [Fischerella sp. NIES-4106]
MKNQLGFVLKVFLLSAVISLLIKYAGPFLFIPATSINALIIVLLPTVIMAIALLWRFQAQKQMLD